VEKKQKIKLQSLFGNLHGVRDVQIGILNVMLCHNTLNGGYLDIHAGGVDLKFPHHENEEAQSCAHLGCQKWSKFWIHTGHLNINGLKMSKSLKNFITIKEVLQNHTSRQIRLCFILHKYNATMDYDDATMEHSINIEKMLIMVRNVSVQTNHNYYVRLKK